MQKTLSIDGYSIGTGCPCFVIAEAGVNHNGELDKALALVDAAKEARADAVKFQTFCAERLVCKDAPKARYQMETTGAGESQCEMLKRLQLSPDDHRRLLEHCREIGILFLSSPFDEQDADFLESLGVPAYKIPSGELTNLPYLAHIARKGKPMIVSTGMATLGEVETAIETILATGHSDFALLHCVSNYPAVPQDVNLRAMLTLQQAFGVPVGYSDHVRSNEVSIAAVALGACIIEKHFTLDRDLPGPDHRASLEPHELVTLVKAIRNVEKALGTGCKRPAASEAETASVARKSLIAACDIPAGAPITEAMLTVRRPGTGLPPVMRPYIIGRRLRTDFPGGLLLRGSLVKLEDLA
ncbi:MAG TPA: N-acetylneuraminate synthase [Candidatus Sumerlaeota bacterium]|nr:N-acetylneuraminate synthase [Candidatus Sumerlaeota bacterium]